MRCARDARQRTENVSLSQLFNRGFGQFRRLMKMFDGGKGTTTARFDDALGMDGRIPLISRIPSRTQVRHGPRCFCLYCRTPMIANLPACNPNR